ncbi:Box C/D snoRNA accumulation [Saxophila tyrrhenica]|uniref:Box C/D snoRNA accumulation n=1 Tax=Saxophila tyrrhenica TaxID=1690608 RepID=A0AAV9P0F3_9PEZI|nr:Box C/D snoRNA accumulation [Saxophila tyrrhenica]
MDKTSLSDLCTICHAETPKYRCPRCRTQTCSLACYKRHQQRAACNGKRDPTTYVKKSKWATPAGVDHDYNYLRGVERSIGDAGQDAQERGIGVAAASTRGAAKAWQPDSGLMKYLSRNKIIVDRAPLGMSRQKNNQTRISKKGKVTWTAEWIDQDSARHLQNECSESASVEDLYEVLQATMRNARKRRQSQDGADQAGSRLVRKQKLEDGAPEAASAGQSTSLESQQTMGADQPGQSVTIVDRRRGGEESAQGGDERGSIEGPTTPTSTGEDDAESDRSSPPVEIITETHPDDATTAVGETAEAMSKQTRRAERSKPNVYYYLLKPGTTGKDRVLIQLDPRATLTDSLQGRTVQEYPTIYVLQQPPGSLPDGFMLDEEYMMKTARSPDISPTQIGAGNACGDRHEVKPTPVEPKQVDAQSILDMLKRDVTV